MTTRPALTVDLNHNQQHLLEALYRHVTTDDNSHGEITTWPTWDYVTYLLEQEGIDALSAGKAAASFPVLLRAYTPYSLIWRDQAGGSRTPLPDEKVGLTMAGLARVDPAAADRLAQMIAQLAAKEANLPPDPNGVREANEPINDLLTEFLKGPPRASRTDMNLRTAAELLIHEYISIASETGRQRIYEARLGGSKLAHFRGMETVGEYLDRITALSHPESSEAQQKPDAAHTESHEPVPSAPPTEHTQASAPERTPTLEPARRRGGISGADLTGAVVRAAPRPLPLMLHGHDITEAEFALAWPKALFIREADALLSNGGRNDELLLLTQEAFADELPAQCVQDAANAWSDDPWGSVPGQPAPRPQTNEAFLFLREHVHSLAEPRTPRKYWQERNRLNVDIDDDIDPTQLLPQYFTQLIDEFRLHGYFARAFPEPCPEEEFDSPPASNPTVIISEGLSWKPTWPLEPNELTDADHLYDVIERLHDLVARPRRTYEHEPDTHYSNPSPGTGRAVYRWKVNTLLSESGVGLQLANEGDDQGRLTTVTDEARTDLVRTMMSRTDAGSGHQVRVAIELYRAREATVEHKRTACQQLAFVLEDRKKLLTKNLTNGDNQALWHIANGFAIRHQRDDQRVSYSPVFLDWIFWAYLATVELADRLILEAAQ